ncbi:hypothetical protein NDU88_003509 [Pleurodeles waltl]|uniref:Uncharacterized protein n=1 Tax=Pleurodeles waltl TaxID=8319 RepID=A0AAV7T560_PLEWA|nr:hypothetical protein NDU88_003509 [Pleurodeles waltl]
MAWVLGWGGVAGRQCRVEAEVDGRVPVVSEPRTAGVWPNGMGRHRQMAVSQQNTMKQYTTPTLLPQRQTRMGGPGDDLGTPAAVEEPL